jgi:hypothetical protein
MPLISSTGIASELTDTLLETIVAEYFIMFKGLLPVVMTGKVYVLAIVLKLNP